ncbi:MAG: hypothetical protein ACYC0K_00685 [Thermoleophilia bacterium]
MDAWTIRASGVDGKLFLHGWNGFLQKDEATRIYFPEGILT